MFLPVLDEVLNNSAFESISADKPIMSESVTLPDGCPRYMRMYVAAWECISSALALQNTYDSGIEHMTDGTTVVYSACLLKSECYLCRHAVELMLKGLCLQCGVEYPSKLQDGHRLQAIADAACDAGYAFPVNVGLFISEIDKLDKNGQLFRYFEGMLKDKDGHKVRVRFDPDNYKVNPAAFVHNCARMYNIIAQSVNSDLHGYRSFPELFYKRLMEELDSKGDQENDPN